MKTCISLTNRHSRDLPERFRDDDVRYSDALVEYFIGELTQEGDVIFDPFAGYGTTLMVAELMKRRAFGIEYDEARVAYAREQISLPERLIHGDSRRLDAYDLPCFDLSITSPPYMCRSDTENPFTAYSKDGRGYDAYLDDIRNIYRQVKTLMKPEAHVVVEVSNLKSDGEVTFLAWDIGKVIGDVLSFQGEIIVSWDSPSYGYDHSYCLVFTAS